MPFSPQGFTPQSDPLGIGLQTRARARKEAFQRANPGVPTGDSVVIPGNWDAWFQAVDESAKGKPVKMAGGASPAGSNQLTGTSVQPGGSTMARRPSLQALSGYGSDQPGELAGPSADEINNRTFAPTYEQARQARVIGDADTRTNAGIARDLQSANENFDLQQLPGRAAAATDVENATALQRARGGAGVYFDPLVTKQRQSELYDRMEELRRRYSDPAIIKGQQALEEARVRGQMGITREGVRGQYELGTQGLRNEGAQGTADTRARASVGAAMAATGADAGRYVAPLGAPRGPNARPAVGGPQAPGTQEMSQDELAQFAQDQGLHPQDAQRLAESYGYRIR